MLAIFLDTAANFRINNGKMFEYGSNIRPILTVLHRSGSLEIIFLL